MTESTPKKKTIVSGMRPTGKLHLGHLSVLENWVRLQNEYSCYYFIADWHALTTAFDQTEQLQENIKQMTIDWLSVGLDPKTSVIFRQSDVKEHAELHLMFSMVTPLSWLERVPTYKMQLQQFGEDGKDISTYGFLGYPLLQAADILLYGANAVPVGEDQVPHVELTREVARRFNHLFTTDVMTEPEALLAKIKLLPGTDNRKMSKSYHNDIALSATPEEVKNKVASMITDPARIKKTDLGHPEICTVFTYQGVYNEAEKETIATACRAGEIGCVACKRCLTEKMNAVLAPIVERRHELEKDDAFLEDVLRDGAKRATLEAEKTIAKAREAMKL